MFKLLKKRKSKRIFVVSGEQIIRHKEPRYPTNPEYYLFKYDKDDFSGSSPEELPSDPFSLPTNVERQKGPFIIKAFTRSKDAIKFAYCCNLDSVYPLVYDLIDEEWTLSKDQSAFDIDW